MRIVIVIVAMAMVFTVSAASQDDAGTARVCDDPDSCDALPPQPPPPPNPVPVPTPPSPGDCGQSVTGGSVTRVCDVPPDPGPISPIPSPSPPDPQPGTVDPPVPPPVSLCTMEQPCEVFLASDDRLPAQRFRSGIYHICDNELSGIARLEMSVGDQYVHSWIKTRCVLEGWADGIRTFAYPSPVRVVKHTICMWAFFSRMPWSESVGSSCESQTDFSGPGFPFTITDAVVLCDPDSDDLDYHFWEAAAVTQVTFPSGRQAKATQAINHRARKIIGRCAPINWNIDDQHEAPFPPGG